MKSTSAVLHAVAGTCVALLSGTPRSETSRRRRSRSCSCTRRSRSDCSCRMAAICSDEARPSVSAALGAGFLALLGSMGPGAGFTGGWFDSLFDVARPLCGSVVGVAHVIASVFGVELVRPTSSLSLSSNVVGHGRFCRGAASRSRSSVRSPDWICVGTPNISRSYRACAKF